MPLGVVYNREMIYQFLHDNMDTNNILALSQGEVSELLGIGQYHCSRIFSEFVALGLLEKHKHDFVILYHPKKVPWDKYEIMRKRYSEHKASKGDPDE